MAGRVVFGFRIHENGTVTEGSGFDGIGNDGGGLAMAFENHTENEWVAAASKDMRLGFLGVRAEGTIGASTW